MIDFTFGGGSAPTYPCGRESVTPSMPECKPPKKEINMIEQYFSSKDKLYNRVYQILSVLEDEFSYGDYYYNKITSIQNTEKSLVVSLVYQEPYEDYTDSKRFIFPNKLFKEEYSEEDVISFWKGYIEQEETYESRYILEQTLLGLGEELLEKLSSLGVDFSRLKDYSYRNEILGKLMED